MSKDTIVEFLPEHLPGKIGIENGRALYYFPGKGLKSLFIDNVKWHHKRGVLLMFNNVETAQEICDAANQLFSEDFEVKPIPLINN